MPTIAAGDFATVNATITPSAEAIAGDYLIGFRANTDEADASMEVRSTVSPSAFGGMVGIGLILLTLAALGLGLPPLRPEIGCPSSNPSNRRSSPGG